MKLSAAEREVLAKRASALARQQEGMSAIHRLILSRPSLNGKRHSPALARKEP